MRNEQSRDNFKSRTGFILAAAGSAVGLGNIWRFPKEVGSNGGGAFVLIYLFFILVIGMSVLLGEFAIGRNGRSSVVKSYGKINKNFKFVGYISMSAVIILLSFYSIVGGWTILFAIKSLWGNAGLISSGGTSFFDMITSNPTYLVSGTLFFLIATAFIVSKGISGGIERYCKILMPILFLLLVVIAVRSVTLPGAMAGVIWYLKPDFSVITGKTVVNALGQAFFTLSLGAGSMITYSSYLNKDVNLGTTALSVTLADTFVALLAGFVTIPAVFAFNLELKAGPGLVFLTLPKVFTKMPMGSIFSILFFFLLFIAAITSSISMLEVSVSFLSERLPHFKRSSLSWLATLAVFIIGIPPLLSFGSLSDFSLFGKNLFDLYDYYVSNLSLPFAGLMTTFLVGYMWNKKAVLGEVSNNGRLNSSIYGFWYKVIKYIAPWVLLLIFLNAIGIVKF
ncbi:MAG: sodium-dependent transporter [Maledivibacter sp.]|nr:sodium-dependent transporter [Maledivibacter sp.]